jgi:hypothetical protein
MILNKLNNLIFWHLLLAFSPLALQSATEEASPSLVAPINAELTGWKVEKGNVQVLEETQKGPGGGRVLRVEGEASISSPIPGLAKGKAAGLPCPQLTPDLQCRLFGLPARPSVCASLAPSPEMCGADRDQALAYLRLLETLTLPEESPG